MVLTKMELNFTLCKINDKIQRNMQVRLIAVTAPLIQVENQPLSPEGLIAYCARVSSPHQETPDYEKLLAYCIKHKHWSVFEMVDMSVEIVTSRAISPQILRHRSFQFQEFSQRYAEVQEIERYQPRRQDSKNRQNSLDDLDESTKKWFDEAQERVAGLALEQYNSALEKGIAITAFPVLGMATTHSADHLITDSGAAGTALATGYRKYLYGHVHD